MNLKLFPETKIDNVFLEQVLKELPKKYLVQMDSNGNYVIDTKDFNGLVDFYPKENRIVIRKTGTSIGSGLNWIYNNLLNQQWEIT